jgi:hypothetical protein
MNGTLKDAGNMKLKTFLSIIYVNGCLDGWNGMGWVDGFILVSGQEGRCVCVYIYKGARGSVVG